MSGSDSDAEADRGRRPPGGPSAGRADPKQTLANARANSDSDDSGDDSDAMASELLDIQMDTIRKQSEAMSAVKFAATPRAAAAAAAGAGGALYSNANPNNVVGITNGRAYVVGVHACLRQTLPPTIPGDVLGIVMSFCYAPPPLRHVLVVCGGTNTTSRVDLATARVLPHVTRATLSGAHVRDERDRTDLQGWLYRDAATAFPDMRQARASAALCVAYAPVTPAKQQQQQERGVAAGSAANLSDADLPVARGVYVLGGGFTTWPTAASNAAAGPPKPQTSALGRIARETVAAAGRSGGGAAATRADTAQAEAAAAQFAAEAGSDDGDGIDQKQAVTTVFASCEYFNVEERAWQPLPPMSVPRLRAVAHAHGDSVVVVGGCDGAERVHASVERFHVPSRRWLPLTALSAPRWGHAAAVVDDRLLVLAGAHDLDCVVPRCDDEQLARRVPRATRSVEVMDLQTLQWVEEPFPHPQYVAADGSNPTGRMASASPAPFARFGARAVADPVRGVVYLMGGVEMVSRVTNPKTASTVLQPTPAGVAPDAARATDTIACFQPATNRWTVIDAILPGPCAEDFAAVVFADTLIVCGGNRRWTLRGRFGAGEHDATDAVYAVPLGRLHPQSADRLARWDSWCTLPSLPGGRFAHTAAVLSYRQAL